MKNHLTVWGIVAVIVAMLGVMPSDAIAGYTWQRVQRPHAIGHGMLTVHDGTLYAIGGNVQMGPGVTDDVYTDAIHAYDLAANQWSENPIGHLPYAVNTGTSPLPVGDRLLIAPCIGPGQNNGHGTHKSLIEWSFSGDAYEIAEYPPDQADATDNIWEPVLASTSNGTVYSFGGWDGDTVNAIYRYDEPSLTKLPSTLSGSGTVFAACRLANNDIALFGRHPSYGDARQVEIFDPDTETITFRDYALPEDLVWGNSAWTDVTGTTYVSSQSNGAVYSFDPVLHTCTPAGFSLPQPTPGFTLASRVAYDAEQDHLYVLESQWDAGAQSWESALWIGVPEPATAVFMVFGAMALVARRRR